MWDEETFWSSHLEFREDAAWSSDPLGSPEKASPWIWHPRLGHCRPEVIQHLKKFGWGGGYWWPGPKKANARALSELWSSASWQILRCCRYKRYQWLGSRLNWCWRRQSLVFERIAMFASRDKTGAWGGKKKKRTAQEGSLKRSWAVIRRRLMLIEAMILLKKDWECMIPLSSLVWSLFLYTSWESWDVIARSLNIRLWRFKHQQSKKNEKKGTQLSTVLRFLFRVMWFWTDRSRSRPICHLTATFFHEPATGWIKLNFFSS